MVEGSAPFLSYFINRPSGGGKRVPRQHRPVPHPVTLVSYFFNLSNRKNDFSISGRIEIQAEFFRLYFHFWPERRGQFFFGRKPVKISKLRPNFSDYISTFGPNEEANFFLGGSRSKSQNSGQIFPTIFQLSALKKCRKFLFDKMYSHFRHKRTKVVRRRKVSLVLNLIFFISF